MFGIFTRIKEWLIGIGISVMLVLAALVVGFRKGDKAGKADVEVKAAQAMNANVIKATTITHEVQAKPAGAAAKQLQNEWSRD